MNEKLLALRKGAGLTQNDLAKKVGVTIQTISRWENGISVPSLESIKKLSELFNVPGSEIFLSSYTTKVSKANN